MALRFLVDINAGRLAKWLRAMGYDAATSPSADDDALLRCALAEDRVLLTRDARLVRRGVIARGTLRALLVRDDDVWAQLRQVVWDLGLEAEERESSRCMRCNTRLDPLPAEEVRDRVPPYVYQHQEQFTTCPVCRRIYWPGTHWRNMRAELARIGGGEP
jgi:uncharacterized protein with PIN domain